MKTVYLSLLFYLFMTIPGFPQTSNNTYILVHGAGHGAWCWNKVIPLLALNGDKVIALDLPSSGDDTIKLAGITLEDDARSVADAANAISGKVILLGHSSGGVVISQAAEMLGPGKVDKLIYLDAFLPQHGESVFSLAGKIRENNKFSTASGNGIPPDQWLIFSTDNKTFKWNPAFTKQLFYHDMQHEDIAYAQSNLSWNALATIATPVHVSDANYGAIKKYYILCTEAGDLDKTSIVSNVRCEKVYKLPSGHSPFFSMPEKLVEILMDIK